MIEEIINDNLASIEYILYIDQCYRPVLGAVKFGGLQKLEKSFVSLRLKDAWYKILNDYTAPNFKESLTGSSLTQANYNLRNSYTDLALPKPRREFLKKVLNTAGQSFGIAFLGKQKKHNQSIFSNKILIFDSVTNVNVWVTPPVSSMHFCK